MKIVKLLLWIVLAGLILSQLFNITQRIGEPNKFNSGFILGKLILIGVFLIIGYIGTRAINQRLN